MEALATYLNRREYFRATKPLLTISLPILIAAVIGIVTDLICLRIIGGIAAINYYLLALFAPINYFLLAAYECYRAPSIAFAATLSANNNHSRLQNYLFIIGILSGITFICGLLLFRATADITLTVNHVQPLLQVTFVLFTSLMIFFAIFRSWLINLLGALCGIGSQQLAMVILIAVALATVGGTYYLAKYFSSAVYAYVTAVALSSIGGIIITWPVLKPRINVYSANIHVRQNNWHKIVNAIYKIGAPIFVSYIVIFLGLFAYNVILSRFGKDVIAGFGVAYQLQTLLILPAITLGVAAGILINKFRVHMQFQHANAILRLAFVIAVALYAVIALLVICFKQHLIALVVNNPAITLWASSYFTYVAPSYLASGPSLTFIIALEQTGFGLQSLILNIAYFLPGVICGWLFTVVTNSAIGLFQTIGALNVIFVLLLFLFYFGAQKNIFAHKTLLN